MTYHVVYHVATLNHWQRVVLEQMALLAANRGWKSLTVSIASDTDAGADDAARLITGLLPSSNVRFFRFPLTAFEHAAMDLADDLAGQDMPVLYFHAKAVGYNPPDGFAEDWRMSSLFGVFS